MNIDDFFNMRLFIFSYSFMVAIIIIILIQITPEDFLSLRKFLKIAKGYQYDFELPQISKDNLGAYCR